MFAMGNAIAIGLRKGLMDAKVPVVYEAELTGLSLENGRVVGVQVTHGGETRTVRARRGVILGSGGFEKNLEMREKYQPQPTSVEWTTGSQFNTGGGILAGIAAGASTDLLDDSWWGPTIPLPNGPWFCLAERNLPGSIIVNQAGERYMNEALPYVEAVHEMYKGEATGVGHVPSWMVIDQRYRNRYLFAGLMPRQPFPGRWFKEGVDQEGLDDRGARRRDRGAGRGAEGDARAVQRLRRRPAPTRTSTAASRRTTSTTPTRR